MVPPGDYLPHCAWIFFDRCSAALHLSLCVITRSVALPVPHYKSVLTAGVDLMGGHSCSGWWGPWEVGPWRSPGLRALEG